VTTVTVLPDVPDLSFRSASSLFYVSSPKSPRIVSLFVNFGPVFLTHIITRVPETPLDSF